MLLRDFQAGDVAAANRVTNHYILHTAIHFAAQPATDDEFSATWLEGSAKYPWLVVELDGQLAGYAKATAWRTRDAYSRTAETGIYLDPTAHGRGVGKSLYSALLDRLRVAGFHTAIGGIALPNPASVKLHLALGFTGCGTFREVGRKFDQWHDVGFWQLHL